MNVLSLMNNELEIYFDIRQLFHPLKLIFLIFNFEFFKELFNRFIQNSFNMINYIFKDFMMHFREYQDFKKWLNSSKDFISIWPNLKHNVIANTGVFIVTTRLLLSTFFLSFFFISFHYTFAYDNIIIFEILKLLNLIKFIFIFDLNLRDQSIFNIYDYSL